MRSEKAVSMPDQRSNAEVLTQWRKIVEVKRALVKEGLITADAKPHEVMAALRGHVPQGLVE